jgi:hypothetical protein
LGLDRPLGKSSELKPCHAMHGSFYL